MKERQTNISDCRVAVATENACLLPVSKRFPTMSTAIWLVPGMRPHVTLQQPGTGESFTTNVALVGQVVCENMHGQGWHADIHLKIFLSEQKIIVVKKNISYLITNRALFGIR